MSYAYARLIYTCKHVRMQFPLDLVNHSSWLRNREGDGRQVIWIIIKLYVSLIKFVISWYQLFNNLLFIFFAGGQDLGKVHQGDSRQVAKKVVLASTQGK